MRALLFVLLLSVLAGGLVWTSSSSDGALRLPGAEPPEASRAAPAEPRERTRTRTRPRPRLPVADCPAGVPACRTISGRVLYVESVDPDGDGDLHVVLSGGGISAPGVTSVDIRPGLRPDRDPRIGSRVSAAGPVQPGSYGQGQIHALEVHFRP